MKILTTIFEMVFFVISVFNPSNTTPLAVIMFIGLVSLWALTSKQHTWISKMLVGFYLSIFYLALIVCLFLGFTSELQSPTVGIYQFQFYEEMIYLGSIVIPYEKFFIFIIPISIILIIGDVIYFAISKNKQNKINEVNKNDVV